MTTEKEYCFFHLWLRTRSIPILLKITKAETLEALYKVKAGYASPADRSPADQSRLAPVTSPELANKINLHFCLNWSTELDLQHLTYSLLIFFLPLTFISSRVKNKKGQTYSFCYMFTTKYTEETHSLLLLITSLTHFTARPLPSHTGSYCYVL